MVARATGAASWGIYTDWESESVMQIHKREAIVRKAESDLRGKVLEWMEAWNDKLTPGEELKVVSGVLGGHLGTMGEMQIHQERHGDSDTPGGLAG